MNTIEHIAVEEASHLTLALLSGTPVREAWVVGGDQPSGQCTIDVPDHATKPQLRACMAIAAAGTVGRSIFGATLTPGGLASPLDARRLFRLDSGVDGSASPSDLAMFNQCATEFQAQVAEFRKSPKYSAATSLEALAADASQGAYQTLQRNWARVVELAAKLIEVGFIGTDAVKAIADGWHGKLDTDRRISAQLARESTKA